MLHAMREAFGSRLIAIAQERYSVDDFEQVETIDELEHLRRTPEEYVEYVEDTTVNYFYAIYLLSRCESLISPNFYAAGQSWPAYLRKAFSNGSAVWRKWSCGGNFPDLFMDSIESKASCVTRVPSSSRL